MDPYVHRGPYAYNALDGIDCEIEHPEFGWIAHSASPVEDGTPSYPTYLEIKTSTTITPAPYVAPPPKVPALVSKIQLVRALRAAGLWDQVRLAVVNGPTARQEDWDLITQVPRADPEIAAVAAEIGVTEAEVDQIFIAAASL